MELLLHFDGLRSRRSLMISVLSEIATCNCELVNNLRVGKQFANCIVDFIRFFEWNFCTAGSSFDWTLGSNWFRKLLPIQRFDWSKYVRSMASKENQIKYKINTHKKKTTSINKLFATDIKLSRNRFGFIHEIFCAFTVKTMEHFCAASFHLVFIYL